MSTEDKLNTKPKRRRWRRGQEEEVVQAEEADETEDEEDARGLTVKKGRPTPGRRQQAEVVEERGNVVTRPINRLAEYLRDVRSELSKVTWPTREEVWQLTRIVLGTTIAAALILGVITLIFTELFRIGLNQPVIFVGLFVVVVALVVIFLRRSSERTTPY
jgi:preprotein translocase subunit SecE